MKKQSRPPYEAVTFFGSDPASSPFVREFCNKLDQAKEIAMRGQFGVVIRTDTGAKVFETP